MAAVCIDRFAYADNLRQASKYHRWRSPYWPPGAGYHICFLNLASYLPNVSPAFLAELNALSTLVETEWHGRFVNGRVNGARERLRQAGAVANVMRRISEILPNPADQKALRIRADAVQDGYSMKGLAELACLTEEVALVAGNLTTWFGKERAGLPTAFGCVRDAGASSVVTAAAGVLPQVQNYFASLHKALRLGDVPAFVPAQLFLMAGEGDRHPKHITYFLPEDEGVARCPHKKTYYFLNTHQRYLDAISLPLAGELIEFPDGIPLAPDHVGHIPMMGVFCHEAGHAVHREETSFASLNATDRWASVVLQETAADVFGILILAEVIAPALQLDPAAVIAYHLAECLRYINRGLGCFPDSDGMFLQLSYLAEFGAVPIRSGGAPLLVADPEVIIAGLRSLARVLADTVLAGERERSLALYHTFGPAGSQRLAPVILRLRERASTTLAYLQSMDVSYEEPLGRTDSL